MFRQIETSVTQTSKTVVYFINSPTLDTRPQFRWTHRLKSSWVWTEAAGKQATKDKSMYFHPTLSKTWTAFMWDRFGLALSSLFHLCLAVLHESLLPGCVWLTKAPRLHQHRWPFKAFVKESFPLKPSIKLACVGSENTNPAPTRSRRSV